MDAKRRERGSQELPAGGRRQWCAVYWAARLEHARGQHVLYVLRLTVLDKRASPTEVRRPGPARLGQQGCPVPAIHHFHESQRICAEQARFCTDGRMAEGWYARDRAKFLCAG